MSPFPVTGTHFMYLYGLKHGRRLVPVHLPPTETHDRCGVEDFK